MKNVSKKVTLFALMAILAVSFAGFFGCAKDGEHVHDVTCERVSVSVLYTSDVHGRIAADDWVVGINEIAALKRTTKDSVLVDAGDFLHGLPVATLTEGKDIVALMAAAGYEAAAVGNHEFDYGQDVLKMRAEEGKKLGFNIISANIKTDDDKNLLPGSYVAEVAGVKIGFIGLTTQETEDQARATHVEGLTFESPITTGTAAAATLKQQGCDVVIALSHVGSDDDLTIKSEDIAKIADIDAVIDGHSHVVLDEIVGDTPLVSPGALAEKVGELTVTVLKCEEKTEILSFDNNLIMDKAFDNSLNKVLENTEKATSEKLAEMPFVLEATWPDIRTKETAIGNFLADSLLFATGADVSIVNGGNIRADLPKVAAGADKNAAVDVTYGDVISTMPYFNQIIVKTVTGAQMKTVLEHAYSSFDNSGAFAQIGGMRVKLDKKKAAGSRIVKLEIKGESGTYTEVSDTASYTLAINDYLGNDHGDNYPVLSDLVIDNYFGMEVEVCIDYIKGCKNFDLYKGLEGRITFAE